MAVKTRETNIYTNAPQLPTNFLLGSLQLITWLFLHPAAWRSHLSRIDPALSPHFCLAELRWQHWRNPILQQTLWLGFVVWPLLIAAMINLGLWSAGLFQPIALAGLAFGLGIGLVFGVTVGTGVGIVVVGVSGALLNVAWGVTDILLIDMMVSVKFAVVFGLTSALAVYITGNLAGQTLGDSPPRQIGSMALGLFMSIVVLALAVGVIAGMATGREGGMLQGAGTSLVVGGLPGAFMGLIVWWRTRHWLPGISVGIIVFLITVVGLGDTGNEFGRDPGGVELLTRIVLVTIWTFIVLFALPYVLVERISGAWAGAVAGAVGSLAIYPALWLTIRLFSVWPNVYIGVGLVGAGLTMTWWRPLLFYPLEAAWNILLLRTDERRAAQGKSLLRWNAAFWDEGQYLPFYALDDHLVLIMERNPAEGQIVIDYISASRQRWAAQAAQIELDARRLERCQTVEAITRLRNELFTSDLLGPASALLRTFSILSKDVDVALTQTSSYNQRLVLTTVEADLNGLLRELTRSTEPYAPRFRPVAMQWRQLVATRIAELERTAEERQEIQKPYVVGVPLTRHQEIFVGRTDISARIEQLLQDQDHPPLLLYGQRRMGKTSLLYNLRWLLPNRIVPLVVDLQGPVALAADHASFLYNVAKGIFLSAQQQGLLLQQLTRDALSQDPFTVFDDWLDEIELALVHQGHSTILLALDEFEALDSALTKGRLSDEAILGTLRHIIQHRSRFKLMLAGSHTLDEFARWSSYLINAQMVHLSYLKEEEARQLIERPIKEFALAYQPAASQRVLDLTRGHPYLVQLLCAEIVTRKNEQPPSVRRLATVADVEAAVPEMLIRGRQFFADIDLHQVDAAGRMVLQHLARLGAGQGSTRQTLAALLPDEDELANTLALLTRRELIEEMDGHYRFQVEAIQRWFAQ